jgi:hypothetical protein
MVDERVIVAADRREAWAFKRLGLSRGSGFQEAWALRCVAQSKRRHARGDIETRVRFNR